MTMKCILTLSRKESNSYVSRLVKFELKNHEDHSEDIETWYFFADTLRCLNRIDLYSHISLARFSKIKCILTLSRENSKSYLSKSVKFELKIMKETPKDIENGLQIKPVSTFFAK